LVRQARQAFAARQGFSVAMVARVATLPLEQQFYSQLLAVAGGVAGQSVLPQRAVEVVQALRVQVLRHQVQTQAQRAHRQAQQLAT